MKSRIINRLLAVSGSALLATTSTHAALTWDANAATAGQTDGAGTWTNANQWWNGTTNVTWSSGSDAIFGNGGTGGAVTLGSATTVNSLTFNSFSGTYSFGFFISGAMTIGSGGITMNAGAGAVTNNNPVVLGGTQSWTNNSGSLLTMGEGRSTLGIGGSHLTVGGSGNTTINSFVNGSGSITKSGAGTLVLSGANTYSGGTTVSAGTIQSNVLGVAYGTTLASGALGTGSVQVNGTLDSNNSNGTSLGGLTGSGTIGNSGTAANSTLTIYGSGTNTFSGVIQNVLGSGNKTLGLTLNSAGTQILTNTNSYTGVTTVNAGSLQIGNGATGSIAASSALVMGGGTLSLNNTTTSFNQAFAATTLNAGASTITAAAANATSGKITLGAITHNAGGRVDFASTGSVVTSTANTAGILGGYATFGGDTWAVANGTSAITGLASYTASGASDTAPGATANVDFQASNTTAWNTQSINSLRFSTGSSSTLTMASGQALIITTGGILVGSGVGSNATSITGGTLLGLSGKDLMVHQNSATHSLAIGSAIADNTSATGFTVSGVGGTVTLSGLNTYTGPTTASGVTLRAGSANGLNITGANALTANNAALDLNGNDISVGNLIGLGGSVTNNGAGSAKTITIGYGSSLTTGNYTGTISNGTGTVALTKSGTGTIVLGGGANTYTGATTINAGTLTLGGDATLANTSSIALNGGNLRLVNLNTTEAAINRVNDSASITSSGGAINWANAALNNTSFSETLGSLTLTRGNTTILGTQRTDVVPGMVQTLTLASLTRTGSTNYSTIGFGSGTGINTTSQIIRFTTSPTLVNGIIGPWAISGNSTSLSDYATVDGSGRVIGLNAGNTNEGAGWSAGTNIYHSGASTLTATRTVNTLRSGANLNLAAFNLETYGVLAAASAAVSASGGNLTIPNAGGDAALYLHAANGPLTISAPITNNSGGAVLTLVGAGGLFGGNLTLSSTASSYSGGTVISSSVSPGAAPGSGLGTVTLGASSSGSTGPLGSTGNFLQVDSGTLNLAGFSVTVADFRGNYGGTVTSSGGSSVLTIGNNNATGGEFKGNLTGGTSLRLVKTGTGTQTLSGMNTMGGSYTISDGTLKVATTTALYNGATASWTAANIKVNAGTLALNVGGVGEFTPGNVTTLLTNLGGANGTSTNGFAAGSNIAFDTTNAIGGTFAVADAIANSTGSGGGAIGLTKLGTGTLVLSNANAYSGATTVSAGTLFVTGALSNSLVTVQADGTIGSNGAAGTLGGGLAIAAGGNLDLTGATLGLDSTNILGLTGGSLALGNLTFQDLVGWDWANAAVGTYELIDGSFAINWGSTACLNEATAYDFGNGKKGYFTSGSLKAVIIPEPRAALLGGLGLLMLLRRLRKQSASGVIGFPPDQPGAPSGGTVPHNSGDPHLR